MADSKSKHVIQYVVELDESDVERQLSDKLGRAAKRAGGQGAVAGIGGILERTGFGGGALQSPTGPRAPKKAKEDVEEEARTLGDAFAKKLVDKFKQAGGPAGEYLGEKIYSKLLGLPGVGHIMSMALPKLAGAGGALVKESGALVKESGALAKESGALAKEPLLLAGGGKAGIADRAAAFKEASSEGVKEVSGDEVKVPPIVNKGTGLGALLVEAGKLTVVMAAVTAITYVVESAFNSLSMAAGHAAKALEGADPNSLVSAVLAAGKGLGLLAALGPAITAPLGAILAVFAVTMGVVNNVMQGLLQTLGPYTAAVAGSLRMLSLEGQMLKIQVAEYLRPAMQAYIAMLEDVMTWMSKNPGLWKDLNSVLLVAVHVLGAVVGAVLSAISWLDKMGHAIANASKMVVKAFEAMVHGVKAILYTIALRKDHAKKELGAAEKNMTDAMAIKIWPKDDPAPDLRQQAIMFNRSFMNALSGKAPGAVGAVGPGPIQPPGPGKAGAIGGALGAPPGPGGAHAAAPRLQLPQMAHADFNTQIQVDANFKLAHESAIREAIERIRDRMSSALDSARKETQLLSLSLDGAYPSMLG